MRLHCLEERAGNLAKGSGRSLVEQDFAVAEQRHLRGKDEPTHGDMSGSEAAQRRPERTVHGQDVRRRSRP